MAARPVNQQRRRQQQQQQQQRQQAEEGQQPAPMGETGKIPAVWRSEQGQQQGR
jgi:hypothetical protein